MKTYISSGTWSLFGVKSDYAITDENSRVSGYLNDLTEKITGKKDVELPIEATAIGNLKVQMNRK